MKQLNISLRLGAAFLLLWTCIPFLASAQVVTPGSGLASLKIGDPESSITQLLGEPNSVTDSKTEAQNYKESNYNPKKELVFFLGFDKVYDYWSEGKEIPVFKVYCKAGKICFIIISAYITTESVSRGVSTPNALHFNDRPAAYEEAWGNPDLITRDVGMIQDWMYMEKGINVAFEDEEAKVFTVYAPMGEKAIRKFVKVYNK